MIAAIRWLSIAAVASGTFTLACIAGARSALPQKEPIMHKARYTAPADRPFAASMKGHTYHRLGCPLLPEQHAHEANLIYFRDEVTAKRANKEPCPECVHRIIDAETASMVKMPTTIPSPKEIPATSQY